MTANVAESTAFDSRPASYQMTKRLRVVILGGAWLIAAVLAAAILGSAIVQDQSTGSLNTIRYGPGLGASVQSTNLSGGFPSWAPSPDGQVIYTVRGSDVVGLGPSGENSSVLATLAATPDYLALSADGTALVAADSLDPELTIFDVDKSTHALKLRNRIQVVSVNQYLPQLLAPVVSADGSSVYVVDEQSHQLIAIDARTGTITSTREVPNVGPRPIAVNPVTKTVYLSSGNRVEFLNPITLNVDMTVQLEASSNACCSTVSLDGKTVYVSAQSIHVFDALTGKPQGPIAVDTYEPGNGPGPLDLSPDGKILYSSMYNAVGLFDVQGKHQVGKVPVDLEPTAVVKTDPTEPTRVLVGPVAGKDVNDQKSLHTLDFSLSRTSWLLVTVWLLLALVLPVAAIVAVKTSPRWVPRVRHSLAEAKREAAEVREAAERERKTLEEGAIATVTAQPENSHTNGFAIASLVLGLVQGGVLAVILGHIALSQIRRTGEQGSGMATAGLILGYLSLAVGAGILLWFVVVASTMH